MPPIHPTVDRALRQLLHRVDFPDSEVLTYDDLHHWGDEAAAAFVSAGLVVPAGFATEIPCPDCRNGTTVRVQRASISDRVSATCWGGGEPHRVSVPIDHTRLSRFCLEGLAALIATQVSAAGPLEVVRSDRIVLAGSIDFRGARHELFVTRGVSWPDAGEVIAGAERLQRSPLPMVLSARGTARADLWLAMNPIVGKVDAVLRWTRVGVAVHFDALAAQDAIAHAASGLSQWLTVTQAARRLLDVRSGIDLQKARARVSRAAGDGKFRTNGLAHSDRRVHEPTFCVWLERERLADLRHLDAWAESGSGR